MVPVSFENHHFSENTPENLLKFRDGLVCKVGFLSGEMKLYFERSLNAVFREKGKQEIYQLATTLAAGKRSLYKMIGQSVNRIQLSYFRFV